MSLQPRDLLKFAELCDTSADEAARRAAISRAYYAAYHCLLPHLSQFPAEVRDEDAHVRHREVWRRLKAWRAPDGYSAVRNMSTAAKRVALDLQAALAARALADYHLGEDVQHSDVIQQCERVKKIVTFAAQVGIQMQRQKVG